jgi:hypothetical protein
LFRCIAVVSLPRVSVVTLPASPLSYATVRLTGDVIVDDDLALTALLPVGTPSGVSPVLAAPAASPSVAELAFTARLDALASARPRRARVDRKPSGGIRRTGNIGGGTGAAASASAASASGIDKASTAVSLSFEPDSSAAMLHRPFATVKLDDLTAYKANLTGGAAAAAAQLSQLQGSSKGAKVSKGREVRRRLSGSFSL